jgi:twitching motility protein PilT
MDTTEKKWYNRLLERKLMDMNSLQELERRTAKRKYLKFTMRYQLSAHKDAPVCVVTTIDVSSKSLAFESGDMIAIGTEIDAEIVIPNLAQTIKVSGSINRIEVIEKMKRYLYSLLFEKIDKSVRQELENYIQQIDIDNLLRHAIKLKASDLHLVANQPPVFRLQGELLTFNNVAIPADELKEMIFSILTEKQKTSFEKDLELDFTYHIPEGNRFRLNIHFEKGNVEAACRIIPDEIKSTAELGLPKIVEDLARRRRGLVIVTGPAGSGKSTTLNAMINVINNERKCMIVSIEDPIEYIHESKKSVIKQREIGVDTLSFDNALKHVLRQDPNVILIGEMRDQESISMAIRAAETGHLVFTTLHTPDAVECVTRIVDSYPSEQQSQVWSQLSDCLEGVIAQLLIPGKKGKERVLSTEVMIVTPAIKNLIRGKKLEQVRAYMEAGAEHGMHTMDMSLIGLVNRGLTDPSAIAGFLRNPKLLQT